MVGERLANGWGILGRVAPGPARSATISSGESYAQCDRWQPQMSWSWTCELMSGWMFRSFSSKAGSLLQNDVSMHSKYSDCNMSYVSTFFDMLVLCNRLSSTLVQARCLTQSFEGTNPHQLSEGITTRSSHLRSARKTKEHVGKNKLIQIVVLLSFWKPHADRGVVVGSVMKCPSLCFSLTIESSLASDIDETNPHHPHRSIWSIWSISIQSHSPKLHFVLQHDNNWQHNITIRYAGHVCATGLGSKSKPHQGLVQHGDSGGRKWEMARAKLQNFKTMKFIESNAAPLSEYIWMGTTCPSWRLDGYGISSKHFDLFLEQLLALSNVSVRLGSGLSIQQWFDSADTSGEPVEHQKSKLQARNSTDTSWYFTGKSLESRTFMHHQSCSWGPDNRFCDSWGREPSGLVIFGLSRQQNGNRIDFKPEFEPNMKIMKWKSKRSEGMSSSISWQYRHIDDVYRLIDVSSWQLRASESRFSAPRLKTFPDHALPPPATAEGTPWDETRLERLEGLEGQGPLRSGLDGRRWQLSYSWATADLHVILLDVALSYTFRHNHSFCAG